MAYQPTYPSPYMEVVDATNEITFKCLANPRDSIVSATLNIYSNRPDVPLSVARGKVHQVVNKETYQIIEADLDPDIESEKNTINILETINTKINEDGEKYTFYVYSNGIHTQVTRIEYQNETSSGLLVYYIYTKFTATNSTNFGEGFRAGVPWNIYGEMILFNIDCTKINNAEPWLSHPVETNTFANNLEYEWSIDIYTKNKKVISSVDVIDVDDGGNGTAMYQIRVVYSDILWNELTKHQYTDSWFTLDEYYFLSIDGLADCKVSRIYRDDSKSYILLGINKSDDPIFDEEASSILNKIGVIYSTKPTVTSSPRYFFKTRSLPVVDFMNEPTITSSKQKFSASYFQDNDVKISYYEFNLYSLGELIASSGHKYSQVIEHTFDNLVNKNSYSIELIIVNDDGMEITESRTFDVDYDMNTVSPTTAIADNYQTFVSVDFSRCISDSNSYGGYLIQRYDVARNELHYIARLSAGDKYFEDYNLRSDNEYEYQILPYQVSISENGTETYSSIIKSNKVYTDRDTWSIIGMKPTDDEKAYTVDYDNVWIFNANVESDAISPIYNKTYLTGMGRFPKEIQGDENYLEGKVSCLLGNVSCNGNYVGDNIDTIKKWQAFCRNGDMKLLKNPKGYVIPCSIKDTSSSVNYNVLEEITTISFSFVQLMDSSDISVYGLGGVDRWLAS